MFEDIITEQEELLSRPNVKSDERPGGLLSCYKYPVVMRDHVPLNWRYDFNPKTNPFGLERLGINAVYNPGAVYRDGKIVLMCRVEGYDRKTFFALAESSTGIDGFRFIGEPVVIPAIDGDEVNLYDPRLVKHQDGWIYALFCAERKDTDAPAGDTSMAMAKGGIARTKDLVNWTRLPDLRTPSPQQRNVVLHPEFVNGKYLLYTRPQDGFIDTGSGGGIAWGLSDSMENPVVEKETVLDPKVYHTITEYKNGMGPAPIKTDHGWLNLAHGVRESASGLRYVLYTFLTDIDEPWRIIAKPGGYLLSPCGEERNGDTGNVLFCNGWVAKEDGELFIYYASSDQRCHVATTTLEKMLDYVLNTKPDSGSTHGATQLRLDLIRENAAYFENKKSYGINRRRADTI